VEFEKIDADAYFHGIVLCVDFHQDKGLQIFMLSGPRAKGTPSPLLQVTGYSAHEDLWTRDPSKYEDLKGDKVLFNHDLW
jgi:hypothetical protein